MSTTMTGSFQGSYFKTGYGPQPIIETPCKPPQMVNRGWNSFSCQYRTAIIKNMLSAQVSDCYKDSFSVLRGGFCGWVWIASQIGYNSPENPQSKPIPAFICSNDWNEETGKYAGESFDISG
jgi:hypothetical protein